MKKNFGFSLLELLVVLTIISILSATTYPIYAQHVAKTHRKQAQIVLLNLANRMEHYYLENHHSYAQATLNKLGFDDTAIKDFYEVSILIATESTYTLQATLKNKQRDSKCDNLTLNQLGEKKKTECW